MKVLKLLIVLNVFAKSVLARPGYNSLSEAIMSSMTNLWNEKHSTNPLPSSDTADDWWDLLDDSDGSDSVSSDENTPAQISYESEQTHSSSYGLQNSDVKSEYSQHPRAKNPLTRKQFSKNPKINRNIFVKSSRPKPGPLHRAIYNSYPISFEELLHYYDYLDYSYEESCEDKDKKGPSKPKTSKISETIETMLTKFLTSLTGLAERPVVVQANVCCSNPPLPMGDKPDLLATNGSTEPTLKLPPYLENKTTTDRYAENQEDLVKQLKEQYDKMVKLLETVGQTKNEAPGESKVELKPEASSGEDKTEVKSFVEQTTIPSLEEPTPPEETGIKILDNPPAELPVDTKDEKIEPTTPPLPVETGINMEKNPKDAVETLPVVDVLPDTSTKQPLGLIFENTEKVDFTIETETTPSIEENTLVSSTKIGEIQASTLKRKRRDAPVGERKKQKQNSKSSKTTIAPTTILPTTSAQYLEYDDVRDILENKTAMLETMVLNDVPIVEHIHEHLLNREKSSLAGEWQPKRSVKKCENDAEAIGLSDQRIIAEPPDFIEAKVIKPKGSVLNKN